MVKTGKRPIQQRYLVKNPCLYLYLLVVDTWFFFLKSFKKSRVQQTIPEKILVIQWAHKGDVIIGTSVLPLLKQSYPQAKFGMLIGSWAQDILDRHPLLDHIHVFDHPKLNRNTGFLVFKIYHAIKRFFSAVQEIKRMQYDVAIDLYCYYPSSHFLTWSAKIPRRIGYRSGGGSPLLTDSLPWTYEKKHMSLYHLDLLKLLGICSKETLFLKSCLAPPIEGLLESLQKKWALDGSYVIFHPYSGNHLKDWQDRHWRDLIDLFHKSPYTIVFTGGSLHEQERIENITYGKQQCVNLAGKLSFQELQVIVKHASALICVDTMIGHLAAVYDVPSLVLFLGEANAAQWKPASLFSVM